MIEAGALVFVAIPCRRGKFVHPAFVIGPWGARDSSRWWLQVGPFRMLAFEHELMRGREQRTAGHDDCPGGCELMEVQGA